MSRLGSDIFAIGVVELDDKPFIDRLRDDQGRFVSTIATMQKEADRAAEKIQHDFRRVPPAIRNVNAAAVNAEKGLAGMSNAATLLGGEMGGMVAQATYSIQVLRNLALAAGPIGALLAVTALATAIGTKLYNAIKSQNQALEESRRRHDEAAKAAEEHAKKLERLFEAEQLQIRARGGSQVASGELERRRRQDAGLAPGLIAELERQERAERIRQTTERREKSLADYRLERGRQLEALEQRLAVLRGEATPSSFIVDPLVRAKSRELELAEAQKAVEAEITAEKRAQLDAQIAEAKSRRDSVRSGLESLAVSLGLRKASEFIDDPQQRLIAQVQEALGGIGASTPRLSFGGGALAFGGVRGPGSTITNARQDNREQAKVDALRKVIPDKLDTLIRLMQTQGVIG